MHYSSRGCCIAVARDARDLSWLLCKDVQDIIGTDHKTVGIVHYCLGIPYSLFFSVGLWEYPFILFSRVAIQWGRQALYQH